jgi:hypothetical protein
MGAADSREWVNNTEVMRMPKVRISKALMSTLVAASGLLAFALATPASAAVVSRSGTPQVISDSRFVNSHLGTCVEQHGSTTTVGLSRCTTNHSEFWKFNVAPASTHLVNVHSGDCLNAHGRANGSSVGAARCTSNHEESWSIIIGSPHGFEVRNLYSHLCLSGRGAKVYQGTCSFSNRADLWKNSP